ncbi:hypothetical protein P152DRAFT_481242 [Eremomyces bilateralis CBS 781.70]|uniref:Uncharacterized protein n=1 Tax=Eremomyces bilateralis CBS 781.70 TaxID=1392243 RepID=A0A6G1G7W7_9PEZI|nr:uncharacterized protein P152DRAFT_481242 [Eremomyces bilateralis CBS 781.70]KAF1814092.1 hypothetical protein P152DRAFT_481242 [Eremomyces bilateralis CBS 781.70]
MTDPSPSPPSRASTTTSSSYILPTPSELPSPHESYSPSQFLQRQPSSENDFDSLPSEATTDDGSDTDVGDESDAEREWRESLQQLELLLTMVVVPYVGKYFGRKCAYWGWGKYMEWKYPVEVVISSPRTFKAAGLLEAASPF